MVEIVFFKPKNLKHLFFKSLIGGIKTLVYDIYLLCRNLLNIHFNTTHYYDGKSLHLYSARKCCCIVLRTFHSYRLLNNRETYESINTKWYFYYGTYLLYIDLVNSRICYPTYCSLDHMFHFHKLLNRRDIRIHITILKKKYGLVN